jgi:hypothetical protein
MCEIEKYRTKEQERAIKKKESLMSEVLGKRKTELKEIVRM